MIGIVTDSTACLDRASAGLDQIEVVPATVVIGTKCFEQPDEVSGEMVAEALASGIPVSTSKPSAEAFSAAFDRLIRIGAEEIVSVHLSARMSGTVDSARLAATRCSVPVHVVDTTVAGIATGFAVKAAVRARAEGADAAKIARVAAEAGQHSSVFVYVATLEYLRRGGRIGAAAALFGSALAVKPLLTLRDGIVVPLEKVRTTSKAITRLISHAVTKVSDLGAAHIGVQHLVNPVIARDVADHLTEQTGMDVVIREVGADIGTHVGPGMVAVIITPVGPAAD